VFYEDGGYSFGMEIEIKARIDDKDAMMQKLVELGCVFSEPKTQDDMVWVEKVGSMDEWFSNSVFMRIRVQNGDKVILTAKIPKNIAGEGNLVKREHEVVVDSAEEARNILGMLGLKEGVRTIKMRRTADYNGYEICLDDVEGLGTFIEVEKIGADEDADQILAEMDKFLVTLGVPIENKVTKGYDILMLEKSGF
jgi:adenylate cyclase class 2